VSRPVDQHLKGLQPWAPKSRLEQGIRGARLQTGAAASKVPRIATDMVTVTGTENFLMAAALAEGETVLENAAQEPEIPDLAEMLIRDGCARLKAMAPAAFASKGLTPLHGRDHAGGGGPHRGGDIFVRGGGNGR